MMDLLLYCVWKLSTVNARGGRQYGWLGAYCRAHRPTAHRPTLLDTDTLLAEAILIKHIIRLVNDQDLELSPVKMTAPDGIHNGS